MRAGKSGVVEDKEQLEDLKGDEPLMFRADVVRYMWAYIRKNNLQNPKVFRFILSLFCWLPHPV